MVFLFVAEERLRIRRLNSPHVALRQRSCASSAQTNRALFSDGKHTEPLITKSTRLFYCLRQETIIERKYRRLLKGVSWIDRSSPPNPDLDFQPYQAHQFDSIALCHYALVQLEIELHPPVRDLVLKMHIVKMAAGEHVDVRQS